MNTRTLINDELKSVAPQLITASVGMPYTLPPDYFTHLPLQLLSLVNEESIILGSTSKENPYQVPAGYFDHFAQSVLQKILSSDIALTKEEPSILSDISREMPNSIPIGYFEMLPDIILKRVATPMQQSVPDRYFESLPEILLAKVRQLDAKNELEEVAPTLNTINRKPVQFVPKGYFENLQPVLSAVKNENAAPVISLKKKMSWLKFAAAASIAVMLSFGAYFVFRGNNAVEPSIANQPTVTVINDQLASLDASTIENYLKNSSPAIATSAISIDELDELNNADLDEMLKEFTDQQLEKHIKDTPELPSINPSKKS